MSEHAPVPEFICRECRRTIVKIDGRWWHLLSGSRRAKTYGEAEQ